MRKIIQFSTFMILLIVTLNASSSSSPSTMNWMSQIPDSRILNQLIIPGTHDSGTADITANSYFSYSKQALLPLWLQVISNIVPHSILRAIVAGWTKTQPYSIMQQLNSGVRYFDFRICREQTISAENYEFDLCNTLINGKLFSGLDDIVTFVTEHPSEFVIINISHVYGVNTEYQETELIHFLSTLLFNVEIPNTLSPNSTMGQLRQTHRHVIILMDPKYNIQDPTLNKFFELYLWRESNIDSPLPNASQVSALKKILDAEVVFRANTYATSHEFFALQAIQTPSLNNVIDGILNKKQYPNSIQTDEQPVNQNLSNWLNHYIAQYQQPAINIVTQDWFTNDSPLVSLAMAYDSLPVNLIKTSEEKNIALQQKLLKLKMLYKR